MNAITSVYVAKARDFCTRENLCDVQLAQVAVNVLREILVTRNHVPQSKTLSQGLFTPEYIEQMVQGRNGKILVSFTFLLSLQLSAHFPICA